MASPEQIGTSHHGAEFSSQDDSGITGLLGRHIDLPRPDFKKVLEKAMEKELHATMESKAPVSFSVLGLPMISPLSPFAVIWIAFIAIMDMTYTAYWVPINVAFCSRNYGDLSSNCTAADLAGGIVYAVHLFMSFHIGAVMVHGYRKKLIMDGHLVAKLYTRHGRFWLDFVAVLPFIYLVIIIAGGYDSIRWVAIVSLFRLVRMGRLFSIGNVILTDIQRGNKNSPVARFFGGSTPAYLFIIAFFATTIINMEGCLLVLVSNFIGKENSWMTSLDWIDIPNASLFYHWYYGIYTAIASNTSTGIFGMQLLHPGEMAVGLFLQVIGALMFTFVATVGLSAITKASTSAMAMYRLREKLKRVNEWLSRRSVPRGLQAEILAHYHGPWMEREQAMQEDAVVAGMPRHLRDQLLQPVTHRMVGSVHFFKALSTNIQSLVAQDLVPFNITKGVELSQEGEPARCCWVMESGVMLACNMKGDVHRLHAPCLFGESLFLGQEVSACRRRLWMYRSAAPCRLWKLSASDVRMLTHVAPDMCTELLEYVQRKLILALDPLEAHAASGFPSVSDSARFEAAFRTKAQTRQGMQQSQQAFEEGVPWGKEAGGDLQGRPPLVPSDDHWCELVCAIMETLAQQPPFIQLSVLGQLRRARAQDGSLQLILDALLAVSTLNKKEAAMLGEALPDPSAVLYSRAARSETPKGDLRPHKCMSCSNTLTFDQAQPSPMGRTPGRVKRTSTFSGFSRHSYTSRTSLGAAGRSLAMGNLGLGLKPSQKLPPFHSYSASAVGGVAGGSMGAPSALGGSSSTGASPMGSSGLEEGSGERPSVPRRSPGSSARKEEGGMGGGAPARERWSDPWFQRASFGGPIGGTAGVAAAAVGRGREGGWGSRGLGSRSAAASDGRQRASHDGAVSGGGLPMHTAPPRLPPLARLHSMAHARSDTPTAPSPSPGFARSSLLQALGSSRRSSLDVPAAHGAGPPHAPQWAPNHPSSPLLQSLSKGRIRTEPTAYSDASLAAPSSLAARDDPQPSAPCLRAPPPATFKPGMPALGPQWQQAQQQELQQHAQQQRERHRRTSSDSPLAHPQYRVAVAPAPLLSHHPHARTTSYPHPPTSDSSCAVGTSRHDLLSSGSSQGPRAPAPLAPASAHAPGPLPGSSPHTTAAAAAAAAAARCLPQAPSLRCSLDLGSALPAIHEELQQQQQPPPRVQPSQLPLQPACVTSVPSTQACDDGQLQLLAADAQQLLSGAGLHPEDARAAPSTHSLPTISEATSFTAPHRGALGTQAQLDLGTGPLTAGTGGSTDKEGS